MAACAAVGWASGTQAMQAIRANAAPPNSAARRCLPAWPRRSRIASTTMLRHRSTATATHSGVVDAPVVARRQASMGFMWQTFDRQVSCVVSLLNEPTSPGGGYRLRLGSRPRQYPVGNPLLMGGGAAFSGSPELGHSEALRGKTRTHIVICWGVPPACLSCLGAMRTRRSSQKGHSPHLEDDTPTA